MGQSEDWYRYKQKKLRFFILIVTVMISFSVLTSKNALVYPASELDNTVNTTLGESLETYAGIFSTAVTASVNPTATLAALSILGMIENAQVYFPETQWLLQAGEFLHGIPLVRTVSELPIANPTAAVLLTIIALAMYIIHSTSASKMFSKATIDNIEQWGGMIVTVSLSLLPLATTQVAAAQGDGIQYVSPGTYAVMLILAILSAAFTAVIYFCIYGCMDALELLGAVIPIKGMNVVIELLKSVLHMLLILLQLFSPILSVAVSILLMIVGILLFRKMSLLSDYYMYIYVKPLWKKLWHKQDLEPWVHRKFPKRGHRLYPETEFAIPAFSMNQIGRIQKRELVWLVIKDQVPYLIRIKAFRKPVEIPLSELNIHKDILYLQKTFRFIRILTEDKRIEIIISNAYENQWQKLLEYLQVSDFKLVEERRKEEKQEAKSQREEQRRKKWEEWERKWEDRIGKKNY